MNIERDRLYNSTTAALLLGISTATLRRWRRAEKGPAWRRLGQSKFPRVYYTGESIGRWLGIAT